MKFLVTLLTMTVSVAMAVVPSKSRAATPSANRAAAARTVAIVVPTSALPIFKEPNPPHTIQHLEFTTSSWNPDHFKEPSLLPQTSNFKRTSLPKISFNWSSRLVDTAIAPAFRATPKLGFSFSRLQRTGSLLYGSQSLELNQMMNVFSVRLGLDFSHRRLRWQTPFGSLDPFLSAALLPTYAQAATSEFNSRGLSESFFGFEFTAGLAVELLSLSRLLDLQDLAIHAGFELTRGPNFTAFNGSGFFIGTKLGL